MFSNDAMIIFDRERSERLVFIQIAIFEGNPLRSCIFVGQVGGQAVLGRQSLVSTPWLTERHGYDPTSRIVLIKQCLAMMQ